MEKDDRGPLPYESYPFNDLYVPGERTFEWETPLKMNPCKSDNTLKKEKWNVICITVLGEKLYFPCRKINSEEPDVFNNYEFYRTGYLIPAEAQEVANCLNEHEK
ncbi:MAG: hypothetical protein IJ601_07270 [Acidaminococcaceae bacterium]|nr:hypothetical protein [Acidaminococcaceae bacterium]